MTPIELFLIVILAIALAPLVIPISITIITGSVMALCFIMAVITDAVEIVLNFIKRLFRR